MVSLPPLFLGIGGAVGWVTGKIGGAVSGVTKDALSGAFGMITGFMADLVQKALNFMWTAMDSSAAIPIDGTFNGVWGMTALIGLVFCAALALFQAASSAVRGEGRGIARAGVGLISYGGVTTFAVLAIAGLQKAVDAMATGIMTGPGGVNYKAAKDVLVATTASWGNPMMALFLGLLMIIIAVITWSTLMVDSLMIVFAAVFAPITFAGISSRISSKWPLRWWQFAIAMVFAKLILAIIWMTGFTLLNSPGSIGGFAGALLTLFIGAFAPLIAIKMIAFVADGISDSFGHHSPIAHVQSGGAGILHATRGHISGGVRGGQAAATATAKDGGLLKGAMIGAGTGGVGLVVGAVVGGTTAAGRRIRQSTTQTAETADQGNSRRPGNDTGKQRGPEDRPPNGGSGTPAPKGPGTPPSSSPAATDAGRRRQPTRTSTAGPTPRTESEPSSR